MTQSHLYVHQVEKVSHIYIYIYKLKVWKMTTVIVIQFVPKVLLYFLGTFAEWRKDSVKIKVIRVQACILS